MQSPIDGGPDSAGRPSTVALEGPLVASTGKSGRRGPSPGAQAGFPPQGMNFIAGYLILITKNEEESFWLLDALVGRILPGMTTLQCASRVLTALVRASAMC